MNKRLTGKELYDYVEQNKQEYECDGDSICIAAGYGKKEADGTIKCNLPKFINELSQASDLNNYEVNKLDDGCDWES